MTLSSRLFRRCRTAAAVVCTAVIAAAVTQRVAAAAPAAVTTEAGRRCIAVVGTNDLHGAIVPYSYGSADAPVRMGGAIGLSAYVDALRGHYGERMLLLDGGDLFQGTMPSNLSEGRAVIAAYNLMGYQAAAIGNHEFDYGAGQDNPGGDRLAVLKARIAEAKFPFLACNVVTRADNAPLAWPNVAPSVLRTIGGIRVGIVGASTPETALRTNPHNVASLTFLAPLAPVRAAAQALRQQGAELVVLVAHMGGACRDLRDPTHAASCTARGVDAELTELLAALPRGLVDVAVGGHTHQFVAHWLNGTAAIESGSRGQYVGWVEACVDARGHLDRPHSTIHAATPLCLTTWADATCQRRSGGLPVRPAQFLGGTPAPMPAVETAMQPFLAAVAARESRPIGARLAAPIAASALAAHVAEAMRVEAGADFGMMNRGGVRQELAAGELTYGQVFNALPFENDVVRVQLTGAQVTTLVSLLGRGQRGAAFAGVAACTHQGHVAACDAQHRPLTPAGHYVLSTNDFITQGGDGAVSLFKELPADAVQTTGTVVRDAVVSWLRRTYPAPVATTAPLAPVQPAR